MFDMRVFIVFISLIISVIHGFRFPTEDEGPIIAVLDFEKRLQVLNVTSAKRIAKLRLMGHSSRGGSANIAFNYEDGLIYWTDVAIKKVYSLDAESGEQRVILEGGLTSPEGITYDWIHKNCYLCDALGNKIIVFKPETGERKDLINIENPKDIKVDPRTGWLYYAYGWESTARIARSGLDGQNAVVLTRRIEIPYSIDIDYVNEQLYYTDYDKIIRMGLNGENRKIFHSVYGYDYTPECLTVAGEYVYWTTGIESQVRRRKKRGSSRITKFNAVENYNRFRTQTDSYMGLVAIHPERQFITENLCDENNGGCSHFCLPSPTDLELSPSFNCHCPNGMVLMENNLTCTTNE